MLRRLFLLAPRDRLPPLLILLPSFPSLPLRSLAFLMSSAVEGLRSLNAEFTAKVSAVKAALLPSRFWLCFFGGVSDEVPLGVFLLSMSEVDDRRGLIDIER